MTEGLVEDYDVAWHEALVENARRDGWRDRGEYQEHSRRLFSYSTRLSRVRIEDFRTTKLISLVEELPKIRESFERIANLEEQYSTDLSLLYTMRVIEQSVRRMQEEIESRKGKD